MPPAGALEDCGRRILEHAQTERARGGMTPFGRRRHHRGQEKSLRRRRSGGVAEGCVWRVSTARKAGDPSSGGKVKVRGRGGRRAPHGSTTTAAAPRGPQFQQLFVWIVAFLACCVLRSIPRATGKLRPQSELTSNCFNFPEQNFDRFSCIQAVNGGNTPYLPLETGVDAIDFTLHDLTGAPWNLQKSLEETGLPVVMIFGMLTCPAFQGYGTESSWEECGYWNERELVEEYRTRATFVHLYGPEPHPKTPGTNFDKGTTWQNYWSIAPQPQNYADRVALAGKIADMIHPDQKLLVDFLPGNPYSELIQPVWCSYAMGARPVTVVTPDSKIFFQRGWFHAGHVAGAIEEYWCHQQQLGEEGEGCSPSGGRDLDMGDDNAPPLG